MSGQINIGLSEMGKRVGQGDPIKHIFDQVQAAQALDADFISLAAGPPPNDLLPNEQLIPLMTEAQARDGDKFMNYGRPTGSPRFCQAVAKMFEEQGVVCEDPMRDIIVTSGGMEGIALTMLALVNEGREVLVESPAFPGTLAAIKLAGGEAVHVACDKDGLDPDALKAAIAKHGALVVSIMPDFQNPSGVTMPLARRKQIAKVLVDTGSVAVEDCVYTPLRFAGEHLPPVQSFAPDNVVLVSSVSKSLAPAERVGTLTSNVVVDGRRLTEVIANMKATINMQASNMLQGLAAEFLDPNNEYLSEHLARLLPHYAKRCELMCRAIAEYMPGYAVAKPDGGMFLWVTGPDDVDFTAKLPEAIKNGVAYIPGSMCYADQRGHNQVRLNFASVPEDKIEEAIRRIARTTMGAKGKIPARQT